MKKIIVVALLLGLMVSVSPTSASATSQITYPDPKPPACENGNLIIQDGQKFEQQVGFIKVSYKWQIKTQDANTVTWQLWFDADPRGGHVAWVKVDGKTVTQDIPECDPCAPQPEIYARGLTSDAVLPDDCNPEPPIGGPQPQGTPAPDDGKSGHRSSLGNDNLQCTNTHFDAVMDVKWDGVGQKDVKVVFYFNGERIETRSNENGRARTQYPIGSGVLIAEADGYPTQSQVIAAPACGPVMLDPDGSVLGATTLASTGSQDLYMAAGIVGSGLSLIGSTVYGYIKKKQNA